MNIHRGKRLLFATGITSLSGNPSDWECVSRFFGNFLRIPGKSRETAVHQESIVIVSQAVSLFGDSLEMASSLALLAMTA
ncbi:MAG: hypothetical protein IT210_15635 [Armatimonadetes bacterium]|nr:hypothetical protein [Armatimonadota bacterium]